jgi:hypothetical protein
LSSVLNGLAFAAVTKNAAATAASMIPRLMGESLQLLAAVDYPHPGS